MDPEVIAAIKENIRSIAQQGGTPAQIDAYLKGEGFATRQEWLDASDMRTPAIPEGNGLTDFLATVGNAAGFGIPRRLHSGLDERLDFLQSQESNAIPNAIGTGVGTALGVAGAALGGGALAGGRLATAANPHALRIATGGGVGARSIGAARTAGQGLQNLLMDPRVTGTAFGASLLERLLDGR